MKPKGHFLQHYHTMTRKFGPLIKTGLGLNQRMIILNQPFNLTKIGRMFVTVWQKGIKCSCTYIILNHLSFILKSPRRFVPRKLHQSFWNPLFVKILMIHLILSKERFFASQRQSSKKATDMGQMNVSYFRVKTTNLCLNMYLLFFITKKRTYFVIYWLSMSLTLTLTVMKLINLDILKYLTLIRSMIIILQQFILQLQKCQYLCIFI